MSPPDEGFVLHIRSGIRTAAGGLWKLKPAAVEHDSRRKRRRAGATPMLQFARGMTWLTEASGLDLESGSLFLCADAGPVVQSTTTEGRLPLRSGGIITSLLRRFIVLSFIPVITLSFRKESDHVSPVQSLRRCIGLCAEG